MKYLREFLIETLRGFRHPREAFKIILSDLKEANFVVSLAFVLCWGVPLVLGFWLRPNEHRLYVQRIQQYFIPMFVLLFIGAVLFVVAGVREAGRQRKFQS